MKITPNEYARLERSFKDALRILEQAIEKSCESCEHWNGKGCAMAQGRTPPEEVQKQGCKSYENDGLPF